MTKKEILKKMDWNNKVFWA